MKFPMYFVAILDITDHLTCLGYIEESASLIYKTRYLDWICPSCLVCSFCGEFIADVIYLK